MQSSQHYMHDRADAHAHGAQAQIIRHVRGMHAWWFRDVSSGMHCVLYELWGSCDAVP